ncbi:hypothetical protein TVAG_318850 [Trichomonas vaginalis G3]|uniref:Uncharacterized protein n=1 Tax=Trichomonas vaginalis (strain ATCC PRA-98 / G3) TaxID=412133 RepID=A2EP63_TRIV3|nr:hypothetical protein TVAGG3_0178220 [Trichomonas vaginalis G3]EAY05530.1 hypothetical protein TVAG_318850 [Trichomonas vaginalis G3]KAI5549089.1 hypothetical protein TVAGG3_0178220 [Trichomonas vaginalis G3]|eukprot:XP_001317753.1 hypothetical protein [Trichomonas vaginalis G3]
MTDSSQLSSSKRQILKETSSEVTNTIFNSMIFESILDFYRQTSGFPDARPIQELTSIAPLTPEPTFIIHNQPSSDIEYCNCLYCNEQIPQSKYLSHLRTHNDQKVLFDAISNLFD